MSPALNHKTRFTLLDIYLMSESLTTLKGSRLTSIKQTKLKNRFTLKFFNHPRNINLLLTIGSSIFITTQELDTTPLNSNFMTRFRKILTTLYLKDISVIPNNKILKVSFSKYLTHPSENSDFDVYLEFYSAGNIILTYKDDLKILDLWRPFTFNNTKYNKDSVYPLMNLIQKFEETPKTYYNIKSSLILSDLTSYNLKTVIQNFIKSPLKDKFFIQYKNNEPISFGCIISITQNSSYTSHSLTYDKKLNLHFVQNEPNNAKFKLFEDFNETLQTYQQYYDNKTIELKVEKVNKQANSKTNTLHNKIDSQQNSLVYSISILQSKALFIETNYNHINSSILSLSKSKSVKSSNNEYIEIKEQNLDLEEYSILIKSTPSFVITLKLKDFNLNQILTQIYSKIKQLKLKLSSINSHKSKLLKISSSKLSNQTNQKISLINKLKNVKRKKFWFEKYKWFLTFNNHLILIGKSADQNISLLSKYFTQNDLFFHSETYGSPFVIAKSLNKFPNSKEEAEAAVSSVIFSSSWKKGILSNEAYSAKKDQISKTAKSGEYLNKGSVSIRGDRKYYKLDVKNDNKLEFGCGVLFIKANVKESQFVNINYINKLNNVKENKLNKIKTVKKEEEIKKDEEKIKPKEWLSRLKEMREKNQISKKKKDWEITDDLDDQVLHMYLQGFKPEIKKKEIKTNYNYNANSKNKITKNKIKGKSNEEEEREFLKRNEESLEFDYGKLLDKEFKEGEEYEGAVLMTGPIGVFGEFEFKVRLLKGHMKKHETFDKVKKCFLKKCENEKVKKLIEGLRFEEEIGNMVDNVVMKN